MKFLSFVACVLVAACGSRNHQPAPPPPLGSSTAPGPATSSVPPPDSAGVPQTDQPTPPISPPTSGMPATDTGRTAQRGQEPMDAGPYDGMGPDDGGASVSAR